ncbi:helix-turn-helix domain-containing protein [Stenotrophomonas maltophilia]|uniref:helix-turn-helix domain-containing protein n=1 Tax=Stenotrophomonas maltophilia TaxID=40324 RepID=UPI0015F1C2BF|nr:helix-turn-helix transcriptional regulator [Stenotrophomonas maltophilia]QDY50196.1 XRE family transcriptional regulator [Stenotrophomonas maltophilia]
MNDTSAAFRASPDESAKSEWAQIGARLVSVRAQMTQADMAYALGVSKTTYSRWERGVREIGADGLGALVRGGWNANWLLTGLGDERLDSGTIPRQNNDLRQSQVVSQSSVKIAAQLLQEALDDADAVLAPAQYGEALVLLAQLLEKGLPEADVRPFARQTVGMIVTGAKDAGTAATGR